MRRPFVRALIELADADERILLMTGDLGFTVIEPFVERHPGRFFNAGVAEQNMIGMATGLAEAGFVPFVYSIATFASLRAYEFVRNGPVLHRLPVRIVGVGGGFDYGPAGPTHHALEDLAVMRALPGMTVIAPADHEQAVTALRMMWNVPGPVYFRLGKDETSTVPGLHGAYEPGCVNEVRRGSDVAIVTTGSIAREAVEAADELSAAGIRASVLVVATISPPPTDDLLAHLDGLRVIGTVENHYRTGGLGTLVSEIVAEHGLAARVVRVGVEHAEAGRSGGESYLNRVHGLTAAHIAANLRMAMGNSA